MKQDPLQQVQQQLLELEGTMKAEVEKRKSIFRKIHTQQQKAARNLLHYLLLRNRDIREIQDVLHIHGLSSLASSESHILRQLQEIQQRLGKKYRANELDTCTYDFNQRQMALKSKQLFGEKNNVLIPYIMVTFDSSFADDYALIKNLLQNGMNVARINCAHDSEATWAKMIHNIKRACNYTGLSCKIYMDLAGPKIRTRLMNKGRTKGKVKVHDGQLVWLAEGNKGFKKDDIVISPNEPNIVSMLRKGDRVYIDDGVIKGEVESVYKNKAGVRIVRVSSVKQLIKNDKGINFPDTKINVPSLTEFDKACLPFVCTHAHLVGYSFVRYPSDVEGLQQILKKQTSRPPNIIVKIETTEAVKNLPALLLKGMQEKVFGVMIARGDLAVEIGFERMGEIQEEILWICEAAHVPVVWATQVLESLNKSGMATRSEITDAAHAAMAECVMINKGSHTIKVIETLIDILHRIGGHHIKKRFTMRPLSIAQEFMNVYTEKV